MGEFYEAVGLDAVLLVEHCGLNAMGSDRKADYYPKAGCRLEQILTVLADLTDAGFSVVWPPVQHPAPLPGAPTCGCSCRGPLAVFENASWLPVLLT